MSCKLNKESYSDLSKVNNYEINGHYFYIRIRWLNINVINVNKKSNYEKD